MSGTDIRVTPTLVIPGDELMIHFTRSGGPGGQNVNRRETKVEVTFDVAGSASLGPRQRARLERKLAHRLDGDGRLRVVADDERSQARNRALAVDRLRRMLADALQADPPPRRPTRPSRASKERRLASKRKRAERKRQRARPPEP